jgi:hypothetical protein
MINKIFCFVIFFQSLSIILAQGLPSTIAGSSFGEIYVPNEIMTKFTIPLRNNDSVIYFDGFETEGLNFAWFLLFLSFSPCDVKF